MPTLFDFGVDAYINDKAQNLTTFREKGCDFRRTLSDVRRGPIVYLSN